MAAPHTPLRSNMRSRVHWLLLCLSLVTALLLPFIPFTSLSHLSASPSPPPTSSSPSSSPLSNVSYVILIDGGSSGTRVHVHPYTLPLSTSPSDSPPLPLISPSFSLKVKPGLSAFPSPSDAAASLLPLLRFASSHIPPHLHPSTPLYLYATAGLRTLPLPHAESILSACRTLLSTYPFHSPPSHTRIISGVQEGINGWIAANYLLSHFSTPPPSPSSSPPTPPTTVGVLEMGGASFQLTYAPLTPSAFPPSTLIPLTIGPHSFLVYTVSYLNYGLEKAQELYAALHSSTLLNTSDPCYPSGLHPTTHPRQSRGDYAQCVALVDQLIRYDRRRAGGSSAGPQLPSQQDEWEHPTGVAGGSSSTPPTSLEDTAHHEAGHVIDCHSCSFSGHFIPPITPAEHFLAIENFYYTSEFFQLLPLTPTSPPTPPSPSDATTAASGHLSHASLDLAAMRGKGVEYCQLSWEEINRLYPSEPVEDLAKYCFSAAYLPRVLEVGLGMVGLRGKGLVEEVVEDVVRGEGGRVEAGLSVVQELTVETKVKGEGEEGKGGGREGGGVLENVRITKHINGVAIDWALGAVLLEITNHLRADVYGGTVRASVESDLHQDTDHS